MSSNSVNRQFILNSRPVGAPTAENFRLERSNVPVPSKGEVLLRTLYLSLDPYMRGRMSDAPSYVAPIVVGEVMQGGTVSRVESSQHPDYRGGDLVLGFGGWQDYSISDGKGLTKLDAQIRKPSLALGVLGMPGFTGYMGLLDIGQPKAGETLVVAAASGAVGSVVGQIGKIMGCRVVGVAGGAEKCRFVVDELGFDACVDRHSADFANQLKENCPKGPRAAVWSDLALQRYGFTVRPGSPGSADTQNTDQTSQGAGLHHLCRLRWSIWRVLSSNERMGVIRPNQIS